MVKITEEMIQGLQPDDWCKAYEELLNQVHKAISYEKGKDQGQALNDGMRLIEAAIPWVVREPWK